MNRFQRWALVLGAYLILWPTVVALMSFKALTDAGNWVLMTLMWATMAVALLPLLPFTIDGSSSAGRRIRLAVPYMCVLLGCLPWAWLWWFYPYPLLIAAAQLAFAVLVHKSLYHRTWSSTSRHET